MLLLLILFGICLELGISCNSQLPIGVIDHAKGSESLKALPKKRRYTQLQTETDFWSEYMPQFLEMPVPSGNSLRPIKLVRVQSDHSAVNMNLHLKNNRLSEKVTAISKETRGRPLLCLEKLMSRCKKEGKYCEHGCSCCCRKSIDWKK